MWDIGISLGDGVVLTTLRTAEEVRSEEEIRNTALRKPDPRKSSSTSRKENAAAV